MAVSGRNPFLASDPGGLGSQAKTAIGEDQTQSFSSLWANASSERRSYSIMQNPGGQTPYSPASHTKGTMGSAKVFDSPSPMTGG